jgi:hypothetical protein
MTPPDNRFDQLFAEHRTAAVPDLWPWQRAGTSDHQPFAVTVAMS